MRDFEDEEFATPFFFNPKALGESLHEVAVDVIKTETQDVVSRWFHSNKDVDVYVWFDEKKNIIKQQITVFGQLAEWNVLEGVKTGHVIEDETIKENEDPQKKPSGSELIRFDQTTQKATLNQVLDLLRHAEAIDDQLRERLLKNFVNSPHFENIDPEEFVRLYGTRASTPPIPHTAKSAVLRFIYILLRPFLAIFKKK